MLNQVIQGDCLKVLETLPDNSVDLIATDPPYFKVKDDWWDRQWDKPAEFLKWLDAITAQWQRVLKPNGSLYCFASPKMSARVEVQLSERFEVLNRIRWVKEAGWHQKANKEEARRYQNPWEEIIFCEPYGADGEHSSREYELNGQVFKPLKQWFRGRARAYSITLKDLNQALNSATNGGGLASSYFGDKAEFLLPTAERYGQMQSCFPEAFNRTYEDLRAEYEDLRAEYEHLRRPFSVTADVPYTDVWTFPTVSAYPGKHPCEKPAELLEHIISVSSRPGAVVLDCFAGSGSTLLAAKNLGRDYIGIEIDPHWVEMSRQRLGQFSTIRPSLEQRVEWLETQVRVMRKKEQRIKNVEQLDLFG